MKAAPRATAPIHLRSFMCPLCHKRRLHAGAHVRRVLELRRLVCWRHPKVGT